VSSAFAAAGTAVAAVSRAAANSGGSLRSCGNAHVPAQPGDCGGECPPGAVDQRAGKPPSPLPDVTIRERPNG
jgi:hypothetical protein